MGRCVIVSHCITGLGFASVIGWMQQHKPESPILPVQVASGEAGTRLPYPIVER